MALSMGGGSLINAIMGQYGSAQRQRRQQQDQLMQMMQRGFVQTDQAEQARQGEGLLSQLLAPPERMRAQDFEMAPWNPARIAEEERLSREKIAADRRNFEAEQTRIQNEFSEEQARLDRKQREDLAKAKNEHEMDVIQKEHELDNTLEGIKQANRMALAAEKNNAGPDEWAKIAETAFMMDEKIMEIRGNASWWTGMTQEQKRKVEEMEQVRDSLMAMLPDEFQKPIKELDRELDGLDRAAGGDSIIETWKPGAGYTNPFESSSLQGGLHSILTGIGQQFGKSTGQTKEINKSAYGLTGPY